MLSKQQKSNLSTTIFFVGLSSLIASCGNSTALESIIQADPQLIAQQTEKEKITTTEDSESRSKPEISPPEVLEQPEETTAFQEKSSQSKQNTDSGSIPGNFPDRFPIYPQVTLKDVKTEKNSESGMLTWTSPDNSKAIADYYQAELTANDWEIIKPFPADSQSGIIRTIATKDNWKVHLTLLRDRNQATGDNGTSLSVIYEPIAANIADADLPAKENLENNTNDENTNSDRDSQAITSQAPLNKIDKSKTTNEQIPRQNQPTQDLAIEPKPISPEDPLDRDYIPSPTGDFIDLGDAPEQLSEPLETVTALGILSPHTRDGNVETSKFAPNAIITRGEYARWLIAANNRYHEGDPGKKIYVANDTSEAAFQDVKPDNPDFGAIQGLAEAGLVPSRLTQDSSKLLFRPNAPLTREDLIAWKVPLDTRQALPQASIEAIEKSWGFQDAAKIDSSAVRALYADYQNGDRSNIRRMFGFTTLFQPKKPITRAEAAASLWYFGFQGDGVTAQEILETETESENKLELESNS